MSAGKARQQPRRQPLWLRGVAVASAGSAISGFVPGQVSAHTPPDSGYQWTCHNGEGQLGTSGGCYRYVVGASLVWHFEGGGFTPQNLSDVRFGSGLWDQTNGHQWNYTEDAYPPDGLSGFPVYFRTAMICGSSSSVGCTSTAVNGNVISVTQMQFRSPSNWKWAAGHEFGHALGLGHSSLNTTIMWHISNGVTALTAPDIEGRCQVYGHALGLWGGCSCPK
ncbi:MAG: matrixin family metalloprotease [Actinobacteria bacterium]|nr:matrixin family metalloprotease [Actinomycetota bacterium]